jgi:SAM-dependent methyltransferase
MSIFYESEKVPVASPVQAPNREAACELSSGQILLGFCEACGFIENVRFDPRLIDHTEPFKITQSCSPTFNVFVRDLAQRLIDSYDLHGKEIVEIGCGRGEFLFLLCELGGNHGTGIDPGEFPESANLHESGNVTIIREHFSEKHDLSSFDLVCCRHTLEHIQPVGDFLRSIRRSLAGRQDVVVFFDVPDVSRILRELAFWDITYEHCSYFTLGSLGRLFRNCGFEVLKLSKAYDGRYLLIDGRPSDGLASGALAEEESIETLAREVAYFAEHVSSNIQYWKDKIRKVLEGGQRAVIWVADTKAGVFLNTLGIMDEIEFVVDINPLLHGMYVTGTGQRVVPPEFLKQYEPDVVIVMNHIYQAEVQRTLVRLEVDAEVYSV